MVRKTVTLVFCDVVDSTPLGERLDPETLRDVWSRYHDTARIVLERHGGTVEKFIGDAVMAAFGIPLVHEDDALRAVRAAAELREEMTALNDDLEHAYGVRIALRTGVNTGEVIAGDPAQGQAFATGDAVVVAQRLEAAAAGGEILLGDATLRLVRDAVRAESVPSLQLKGKSEAVDAWRLLAVEPGVALGVARRMDAPFVGRSGELARLKAELGAAVSERACRVVTIIGEPGVGKSRLAAELIAAGDGELEVLEGRCLPYGTGVTYWPLVEIVRRLDLDEILSHEEDGDVVHGRVLEAVGRAEARARRDELYWSVRRLFETLARRRPLLVVLDDIQWAEPAFLDLIEYLAGWSRDAPILVCCLARTDLMDVRPAWSSAATITLTPLPREELQTLIEHLAGGPLEAGAVEALGRATGGNPLFLGEMLRMLVEDGVLVEHENRLESRTAVESVPVPETVQAVLAARLDRLEPEELAVLQRASVIGQVFWWGAVADVTPADEADSVAARLQALVRKGLIRPDRRTFAGEDGFRFGHILIRDAAYDSMSKRLRAELHERFADWVEQRAGAGAELDEILGHHLEQAHLYGQELGLADGTLGTRASVLLARAGRRALAREDNHAAASLLGRSAALLDEGDELAAVVLDRATALHRAGLLEDAVELFDRLQDGVTPQRVAAAAQLERAFLRISSGEGSVDEVLEAAERATTVFTGLGDEAGLAQAWNSVATQFFWRGLTAQMEEAALRALAHARAADDPRQELWATNALCIALAHGPTPAKEGARRCRELLARGEELGADALPLFALAGIEAMRGRLPEAWELYERGVARGVGGVRASVSLYAQPLFELDPARAEDALRTTLRTLDEIGIRTGRRSAALMLAEALLARGAREEAGAWLPSPDALAFPAEDVTTMVLGHRTEARLLGGADGVVLARRAVTAAREAESPQLLAGSLAVLAEVTGTREPLVEAAALWEAKGNVLALQRLDIAAAAR